MHIVFGAEQVQALQDRYTILKLDTIQFGEDGPAETAYCIIETVPLTEIANITELKQLHNGLIENYNTRNWDSCVEALGKLVGAWNKEVDSFYADMLGRIHRYRLDPPDDAWSPIILKDSPKS